MPAVATARPVRSPRRSNARARTRSSRPLLVLFVAHTAAIFITRDRRHLFSVVAVEKMVCFEWHVAGQKVTGGIRGRGGNGGNRGNRGDNGGNRDDNDDNGGDNDGNLGDNDGNRGNRGGNRNNRGGNRNNRGNRGGNRGNRGGNDGNRGDNDNVEYLEFLSDDNGLYHGVIRNGVLIIYNDDGNIFTYGTPNANRTPSSILEEGELLQRRRRPASIPPRDSAVVHDDTETERSDQEGNLAASNGVRPNQVNSLAEEAIVLDTLTINDDHGNGDEDDGIEVLNINNFHFNDDIDDDIDDDFDDDIYNEIDENDDRFDMLNIEDMDLDDFIVSGRFDD